MIKEGVTVLALKRAIFEKWGDGEGRRRVAQMTVGVSVSVESPTVSTDYTVSYPRRCRGDQIVRLLSLEIFYFCGNSNTTECNLCQPQYFCMDSFVLDKLCDLSGMLSVSVLQFCLISLSQCHIEISSVRLPLCFRFF